MGEEGCQGARRTDDRRRTSGDDRRGRPRWRRRGERGRVLANHEEDQSLLSPARQRLVTTQFRRVRAPEGRVKSAVFAAYMESRGVCVSLQWCDAFFRAWT